MRFSANVSILFKEVPFLDRFGLAREAGFSAVSRDGDVGTFARSLDGPVDYPAWVSVDERA